MAACCVRNVDHVDGVVGTSVLGCANSSSYISFSRLIDDQVPPSLSGRNPIQAPSPCQYRCYLSSRDRNCIGIFLSTHITFRTHVGQAFGVWDAQHNFVAFIAKVEISPSET